MHFQSLHLKFLQKQLLVSIHHHKESHLSVGAESHHHFQLYLKTVSAYMLSETEAEPLGMNRN